MNIQYILLVTLALTGCAPAETRLVRADFIAGPKIDQFSGKLERGGEYACSGEIVTTEVSSIPANDDLLVPDLIHELSVEGAIIRKWRVPLEADPIGIEGDRLKFNMRRFETVATASVDLDGKLRNEPAASSPADSSYGKCPANSLPESGYRWCVTLTDETTKADHLIAYDGPCT